MAAPSFAPIDLKAKRMEREQSSSTSKSGFTQVPNSILCDARISPQGRLLYGILKSYDWNKEGHAYPGRPALAAQLGVSERQISTYLGELEASGLVEAERRGYKKTCQYILTDQIKADYVPADNGKRGRKPKVDVKPISHQNGGNVKSTSHQIEDDVKPISETDVKSISPQPQDDVKPISTKEYEVLKNTNNEEYKEGGEVPPTPSPPLPATNTTDTSSEGVSPESEQTSASVSAGQPLPLEQPVGENPTGPAAKPKRETHTPTAPPLHPAVIAHQRRRYKGNKTPRLNDSQVERIIEAIGNDPARLSEWAKCLDYWSMSGWAGDNIRGMLSCFREGNYKDERQRRFNLATNGPTKPVEGSVARNGNGTGQSTYPTAPPNNKAAYLASRTGDRKRTRDELLEC